MLLWEHLTFIVRHVDVDEYFTQTIPSWINFFQKFFSKKIDPVNFEKLWLSCKLLSFHLSKSTDQVMNNEGKTVLITNQWLEWVWLCWQEFHCGTIMMQWHKKSGMRPNNQAMIMFEQAHWRCQQWKTNALKEEKKRRPLKLLWLKKIHASIK